jgi:hypothetical protein
MSGARRNGLTACANSQRCGGLQRCGSLRYAVRYETAYCSKTKQEREGYPHRCNTSYPHRRPTWVALAGCQPAVRNGGFVQKQVTRQRDCLNFLMSICSTGVPICAFEEVGYISESVFEAKYGSRFPPELYAGAPRQASGTSSIVEPAGRSAYAVLGAAQEGHVDVLRFLLEHGPTPIKRRVVGSRALLSLRMQYQSVTI